MTEILPLQCSCGVTAFTDIRFSGAGIMSATCFHCRQTMEISMSAVVAEQAWAAMEREAPEPVLAEPEKPAARGYKYGGML